MTDQLSLYNGALRELGERRIASLAENREPRRVLDDVWGGGRAIDALLEEADWKFAQRTSKLVYNPGFTATFGYRRQFDKPTDMARISRLCTDPYLQVPLLSYVTEATYWFCDLDELYISYVSKDTAFGYDMSLWPQSFIGALELYMAMMASKRLEQSDTQEAKLIKKFGKALTNAKSKDALQGPTGFLPPGGWITSRSGNGRGDRGSLTTLIG